MKRTRISKTAKKDTLTYWKKEFWKVFSLFIRTRDDFTCFTCGKGGFGKGMHGGHFIPKIVGGLSLYFFEKNVHAQCYFCNLNLGGYGAEYYRRMLKKYSKKTVDNIFKLRDDKSKVYTIENYKSQIKRYKKKIEKLNE